MPLSSRTCRQNETVKQQLEFCSDSKAELGFSVSLTKAESFIFSHKQAENVRGSLTYYTEVTVCSALGSG